MSTVDIRPYWLELMKDVLYRKSSIGPLSLFRAVENVSMHTPPEAWESMPFNLGDFGYKGSGAAKQKQWKSYYWPPEPEWNLFQEKIEALRGRGGYYASIALPLKGVKTKEDTLKSTKGNCLLNLVVNITRGRKGALAYKVWLIGRYTEIIKKLGADLYFVHGLLLPKVRSIVEDVLPEAKFRGVDFYFTAAYLVYYRVLGLALVTDAPDVVLREALEHARRSPNQDEITFLKTTIRRIIEAIDGTVTRFRYQDQAKIGVLYGPRWIPYEDVVREIWEEIENVGN